jgi:fermentation-respiration switch protein FrsA (DUF1100 family)
MIHAMRILMVFLLFLPVSRVQAEDIFIKTWQALGPFLSGPRDFDIDYLLDYGGEESIVPTADQVFHSVQSDGGLLRWFELSASGPHVQVIYPRTDWPFLVKLFGYQASELTNNGYAHAEISFDRDTPAVVLVQSVHTFWVNGIRQDGEFYTHAHNATPVIFKAGKNRLLLKFHAQANPSFSCLIRTNVGDVHILDDFTIPDILRGRLLEDGVMGLPIANTTSGWLRGVRVVVSEDGRFSESVFSVPPMAPLSVMKIPLPLSQKSDVPVGVRTHDLNVRVLRGDRLLASRNVMLRVQNLDQPHRATFISQADGSAQYYGMRFPRHFDPSRDYGLIMSLHGGGDEGLIMAEAHDAKDWAFVAAPTNRRPRGFAWHDLGRIDLFESIADMKSRFSIDVDRISLTGASMGGQGSWYNGLMHPDLFAAIAPEAGYSSRQIYSPFHMQKGVVFAHPGIKSIIDRLYLDTHLPYFLENALHLPVMVTHGSADDVVPPIHARLMVSGLRDLGYPVVYREFPGKPHFWFEPRTEEGEGPLWGVCIDHPEIMSFLEKSRRVTMPRDLRFRVLDLSVNDTYYWLTIREQVQSFSATRVEASIREKALVLKTANVRQMEVHLPRELLDAEEVSVTWNGRNFSMRIPESRRIVLGEAGSGQLKKTPALHGPLKTAFFRPFVLVYGTQGTARETEVLLNNARYFAKRFWRWANGYTRIVPDGEVDESMLSDYNLILFGSQERNSVTARMASGLPIRVEGKHVRFGGRTLAGEELAVAMVYPNPLNPNRLAAVYSGTSLEMEKASIKALPIFRNFSLPDFLVTGPDIHRWGWAGIRAAGFFSPDWDLANRDYFLEEDDPAAFEPGRLSPSSK